jgi:hypothetical protein
MQNIIPNTNIFISIVKFSFIQWCLQNALTVKNLEFA